MSGEASGNGTRRPAVASRGAFLTPPDTAMHHLRAESDMAVAVPRQGVVRVEAPRAGVFRRGAGGTRPAQPVAAILSRTAVLAAALAAAPASALQLDGSGPHQIDVWTPENGLPGGGHVMWELIRSPDGYLWMRTPRGLTRFDGTSFVTFTAHNTPAFAGTGASQRPLTLDRRGRLWIATATGLVWYADGRFHRGPRSTENLIKMAEGGDGTLWAVSAQSRLFRAVRDDSGAHMEAVSVPGVRDGAAEGVAADGTGAVWIPTDSDGVARITAGAAARPAVRMFTTRDGLAGRAGWTVSAGAAGAVWVAGPGGLTRIHNGQFTRVPFPSRDAPAFVYEVAEAPDGTAWIATHGGGLLRYHPRDGRLERVDRTAGLSDDYVLSVRVDPHGNVWAATQGGLNRIRPVAFRAAAPGSGASREPPQCLLRDRQGRLWLSTESGALFRAPRGALAGRLDRVVLPPGGPILSLEAGDRGSLWIARWHSGAVRVDGTGPRRYTTPSGLPLRDISSVFEDSRGTLWIGRVGSLTRVRAGRDTTFTARDGLHGTYSTQLVEGSDGVVWAGGLDGLTRIANDSLRAYRSGPRADDSVSLRMVLGLYRDRAGTVWVGTTDGLTRIRDGPDGPRFATIRTRHAFPDDRISAVVEDDRNNLWVVGVDAIARVPLAELNAVADGRKPVLEGVAVFGREEGLAGGPATKAGHCHQAAAGDDGRLWFAMARAVVTVDPDNLPRDTVAPQVHLAEVQIDGVSAPPAAGLTIPAAARRLEVRYTGVDLRAGPELRFAHRLDGFDQAWVDAGPTRSASYTNLPPGRYHFRVRARAATGRWSARAATLEFRVLPPFYRTGWFAAAGASLILAALWAAQRLRDRALRAQFVAVADERARLAREVHDTVAQGLAGVVMQLAAAREKLGPDARAAAHLDLVDQLARDALGASRQAITDLRPNGPDRGGLDVGVQRIVAELERRAGTRISVAVTGTAHRAPPEVEFELLRIAQAALANAVGHAEARHIRVDVTFEATGGARVTVVDDGRGFDPNAPHPGRFGLVGMSERAARIGAVLTLASAPGEGTEIVVRWSPDAR